MIKIIRAFKTKIYPTKKQRIYFNKCFGIRRFAWNWGLENWENYKSWTRLDRVWNHDENLKLNVVLENKKITLREYFLSCIIKDYKIIRGLR